MASSGSVVSDFANITTQMPFRKIFDTVEYNNVFFKLFNRDTSRLEPASNADYWRIQYYDGLEITAAARSETGDVVLPGGHSASEGRVYPTEITGSIGWTQWQLNLLDSDPNAFARMYVDKLRHFIPGYQHIHQCVQLGDGTGRLARVSAYSASTATTGTLTIDSDIADFGITDKGAMLKNGQVVDIYTAPPTSGQAIDGSTAWVVKATSVVISNLNRTASSTTVTMTITTLNDNVNSEITTDPANGDTVFLQNSFTLASDNTLTAGPSAWNYTPGLWAMVDADGATGNEFGNGSSDAYNGSWRGSTIQNISRTNTALYRSTINRAGDRSGTSGTAQETTWDELADVIRDSEEDQDFSMGDRRAVLANGAIIDWLGAVTRNVGNATITLDKEEEIVPGLKTGEFLQTSNGRIPMFRIPMMSKSVLTVVTWDDIFRIDVEPMGSISYGGQLQFPSPGTRNRTYESWYGWGGANWFSDCRRHVRIEDIDRAYP